MSKLFSSSSTAIALTLLPYLQLGCAAPTTLSQRQIVTVPDFVTKYAPIVWLSSTETYMPSDIGAQLQHTKPETNFTPIAGGPDPLTLDNLGDLNALNGSQIYLSSDDDITSDPAWWKGVKPDADGITKGIKSCAVIVNDHGNDLVDAFYMYFYAYNWGGMVFGSNVDDHVGDWEHTMVRFQNQTPTAIWLSQHAFGQAFEYQAMEKQGLRPVVYSANGSHANYAVVGKHSIADTSDKGILWDPVASAYFYEYDVDGTNFTAYDGSSPTSWLNFVGRWGDQQLPNSDPRQHKVFGISATVQYANGPIGPEDKQLNRTDVCPTGGKCNVQTSLGP